MREKSSRDRGNVFRGVCCVLSQDDPVQMSVVSRQSLDSEGREPTGLLTCFLKTEGRLLRMVSVHGGGSRALVRGRRSRAREGHSVDALAPGGDEGRGTLRKATGSREQALIRGCPNGATHPFGVSPHESIVWRGEPGELKYLSTRRKRHQPRFRE